LRYVRVNALDTPWCEGDLLAVLPAASRRPIVLPKVTGPEDLDRLAVLIGRWEVPAKSPRRPGSSPSAPRRPRPPLSLGGPILEASAAGGPAVGWAKTWRPPIGGHGQIATNRGHYNRAVRAWRASPLPAGGCTLQAVAAVDAGVHRFFATARHWRGENGRWPGRDGFTAKAAHSSGHKWRSSNTMLHPTEAERRLGRARHRGVRGQQRQRGAARRRGCWMRRTSPRRAAYWRAALLNRPRLSYPRPTKSRRTSLGQCFGAAPCRRRWPHDFTISEAGRRAKAFEDRMRRAGS